MGFELGEGRFPSGRFTLCSLATWLLRLPFQRVCASLGVGRELISFPGTVSCALRPRVLGLCLSFSFRCAGSHQARAAFVT